MNEFLHEIRASLRSRVTLATWGFLTVMLAVAGPFGSYQEVGLLKRLGFWLALTALCILLTLVTGHLVRRVRGLQGFWGGGALTAAGVSALLTAPLSRMAERFGDSVRMLPPEASEIALFVFCMTMGFCALRHALEAQPALVPLRVEDAPAPPPLVRLAERLPPDCQGRVLRVSGRDHYVEVETDTGTATLLMRFSDALAELEGCDGLRVHRSHWVAAEAVSGTVQDNGRVFLRLGCGMQIPVSRTYMAAVAARGWLAQG